jgi:GGDEF domain-containing protein
MFLSLKRHWEDTQGELNNAFTFFSQEMLRAMRVHPVSGDPADLEAFQAELYALENAMSNGVEPDYLLESAKTLPLAVQNYSARTNRYFRIQAAELHNMLSMMAETIKAVAATSETAATGLVQVERQIETASQHEDLRRLKTELAGALAAVRAETLRQREETRRTIQTLSRSMDESRQRLAESAAPNRVQGNRDPVTGLQGRLDAENDLAEARQDSHAAAVVLPVDRHTLIQIRFGHEAGDNVLRFLASGRRTNFSAGRQAPSSPCCAARSRRMRFAWKSPASLRINWSIRSSTMDAMYCCPSPLPGPCSLCPPPSPPRN